MDAPTGTITVEDALRQVHGTTATTVRIEYVDVLAFEVERLQRVTSGDGARIASAQAEFDSLRTLVRDYWAAMADEDLDDEAVFRQRLFDWAGI